MKDKSSKPVGRRDFLRTLGAGGATLAATAAAPLSAEAQSGGDGDAKTKARYRESEHVKTYYRVNRY